MKILAVDDEPDMEALISQRFRKQIRENQFNFVFARNGNEALEKLAEHQEIALVLTDINMPGMDGLTLLSKIKELQKPIQSLVISAYGDLKNIRTAMNQGAFDFLIKPIDFQDFEITLNKTIENVLFVAKSLENEQQLSKEREEKLKAQEDLLKQLKENAEIISQQNIILEAKVQERTQELVAKNEIISIERDRSEKLLLNILPFEIAKELKEFGTTQAKNFDQVTVMFTDFKDFTKIAANMTPQELVAQLDRCFKAFDNIIDKYQIEKIKTIGDSYMVAAGLPIENTTHAVEMVNAAIEIQDFMNEYILDNEKSGIKGLGQLRIGINTGPLVAGVVGNKKFVYDIWGDAVNLASRMESYGEPGKINISANTFNLIKDKFNCTYRGEIAVKNKGDVGMYFVD
ncbi:MAG TPA: adenylate/guanylate cyclase domain-containing protein [Bacteroidia bacterium]|nr:adenylate/guanylate cyclase domain-containing protein [Bacteroidia bacterium]